MALTEIKGTKTTQQRMEHLRQARLPPNQRKKRKVQPDGSSLKESELRSRPAWDLRGQMTDIESLLNQGKKRLEYLSKEKAMMDFANQEEHHELKKALIRLNELRTEHQNLKLQHKQNIKDIEAKHRIYNQELHDTNFIYKTQEKTIEIEASDLERRYHTLLDELEKNRERNRDMASSLEMLNNKNLRRDKEIAELKDKLKQSEYIYNNSDRIIHEYQSELKEVDKNVEKLQKKVAKAHEIRDRLLATVKDLEESKQSRSWLLAHQNDNDESELSSPQNNANNKNSYFYDGDDI